MKKKIKVDRPFRWNIHCGNKKEVVNTNGLFKVGSGFHYGHLGPQKFCISNVDQSRYEIKIQIKDYRKNFLSIYSS